MADTAAIARADQRASTRGLVRKRIGRVLFYVLVTFSTVVMSFPMYWMFSRSLMTSADVQAAETIYVPAPNTLTFENYLSAFITNPYVKFDVATGNSIIYTAGTTIGAMLFASMAAYALSKRHFRGDTFVLLGIIATMMIPSPLVLIPNFIILVQLGWVNTYQGLIIPGWSAPLAVFMIRQYMLSIPDELIDAAHIDGASELQVFWRIMLPLSKPILISYGLLEVMWTWNGVVWPLIVTRSRSMLTLPVALLNMNEQDFAVNWGAVMAGGAISCLPIIIMFLLGQKYIVGGLLAGALKQ